MKSKSITIILVLAICILTASSPAETQDRPGEVDVPPVPFQVYSFDGKQSLKGVCRPRTPDVMTCNFILVMFFEPDEMTSQEEKKTTPKTRERQAMEEEMGRAFCSSEIKTAYEKRMLDPQIGPKTRKYSQQMVEACSAKDPRVFLDNLSSVTKRTCGLLVEPFSLDFKKIGKGQWLSNPGPQGVCSVVKTYVLKRDERYDLAGVLGMWTLTETIVARGTESPLCKPPLDSEKKRELNKPFVWSWNNYNAFEIPACDFIMPTHVLPDIPGAP